MLTNTDMMEEVSMGGVTLRSLLEKRDHLASSHPRGELESKEYKLSGDPYCDAAAAFLGPNLWDKTLSEFKLEYLDLDDLLLNNGQGDGNNKNIKNCSADPVSVPQHMNVPAPAPAKQMPNAHLQYQGMESCQQAYAHNQMIVTPPTSPMRLPACAEQDGNNMQQYNQNGDFSTKELALATPPGEEDYNPASVTLQEDDLKPQPMIRKSQKNFVPDDMKDDRYWARRRKNNLAAKRSREARRIKENQIVLRASFLEKENNVLKDDVMRLKAENDMLRNQLKKMKRAGNV